jgi:hypothetical protein
MYCDTCERDVLAEERPTDYGLQGGDGPERASGVPALWCPFDKGAQPSHVLVHPQTD